MKKEAISAAGAIPYLKKENPAPLPSAVYPRLCKGDTFCLARDHCPLLKLRMSSASCSGSWPFCDVEIGDDTYEPSAMDEPAVTYVGPPFSYDYALAVASGHSQALGR